MKRQIVPRDITPLTKKLAQTLTNAQKMLVTAESCSGGGIAYYLTEIAGSSTWFERAFVTYSNRAKQEMLEVDVGILEKFGAVSEQTVMQMVTGALQYSPADIAVAVSGIAGPSGGSEDKPVGTVCFAWRHRHQSGRVSTQHFDGNREQIRLLTIEFALRGILQDL